MRLLIVDNQPIVRLGVSRLVEGMWPEAIVDQADTASHARECIARSRPDAITLEPQLPDAQGTEALSHLLRAARGVPILVLSQGDEPTHSHRAMQLGASGYLAKTCALAELAMALTRVLNGERYVNAALASRLLAQVDDDAPTTLPHETLTVQEYRVMQLIASGVRAAHIAATMNLSPKTVANYRSRIFGKTGWHNNIELAKYCVQHGLTSPH